MKDGRGGHVLLVATRREGTYDRKQSTNHVSSGKLLDWAGLVQLRFGAGRVRAPEGTARQRFRDAAVGQKQPAAAGGMVEVATGKINNGCEWTRGLECGGPCIGLAASLPL